jgi:hypothetical protein
MQSDLGKVAIFRYLEWMQWMQKLIIKKVEQNAQDMPLRFSHEERREDLNFEVQVCLQ